jgi:DNA-binding MarR family transcriptional regulator
MTSTNRRRRITDEDYRRLLEFRDGLRRFLHWSEEAARQAGLTPAQHQLLLAIRGHGEPPSVRQLAEHLLLRHHSVVELVDRAEKGALVERVSDRTDNRVVRVALTPLGTKRLEALAADHIEELSRVGARLAQLSERLPQPARSQRTGAVTRPVSTS